ESEEVLADEPMAVGRAREGPDFSMLGERQDREGLISRIVEQRALPANFHDMVRRADLVEWIICRGRICADSRRGGLGGVAQILALVLRELESVSHDVGQEPNLTTGCGDIAKNPALVQSTKERA